MNKKQKKIELLKYKQKLDNWLEEVILLITTNKFLIIKIKNRYRYIYTDDCKWSVNYKDKYVSIITSDFDKEYRINFFKKELPEIDYSFNNYMEHKYGRMGVEDYSGVRFLNKECERCGCGYPQKFDYCLNCGIDNTI